MELETCWTYVEDFTRHRAFSSTEEAEYILSESLKIVFADEPETYARMNAASQEAFSAARRNDVELARRKFLEMIHEVAPQ